MGAAVADRDHAGAAELASAAAATLREVRRQVGFADPAALRREGDARAEECLQELLAERFPDDAVLSEESADHPARLGAPRVWVVDPLDGTKEFAEEGREDFAVHVALVVGHRPLCAAVALPARNVVLATGSPVTLPERRGGRLRLAVSRSHRPPGIEEVADALGAELVPMGSAGVKVLSVVSGETDLYVHMGGQHEWDSAAPVGVATAAGLHASRVDGTELLYNQPEPWLPDLVVCRPELADRVLDVLAGR